MLHVISVIIFVRAFMHNCLKGKGFNVEGIHFTATKMSAIQKLLSITPYSFFSLAS